MEIEKATNHTLSALTFDERPLARDLFRKQQTAKEQKRVWLRAPSFSLAAALSTARKLAKDEGFTAKFINIYCDTLIIREDVIDAESSDEFVVLGLFARKLESTASGDNDHLTFNMSRGSEIILWTPNIPLDFKVRFNILPSKTSSRQVPSITPGNFAISYSYNGGALKTEQYDAPDISLKTFDYLSLVQEDGTIQDQGFLSDNIARLLQFQLLVAQANMHQDRQLAVDLLGYIIAATNTPFSAPLNYQARSLWNSLTLSAEVMAVSSVNIYSSKQILKARLMSALEYERAFRIFALESDSTKIQSSFAVNLIAKSQDALQTFDFLTHLRQRDYSNAITANDKASATYKKNQSDIDKAQQMFERGIVAYKKQQEIEAAMSILKAIFGVALAIGAVVATAGAAAPVALPAAGAALSSATKIAQLISKLTALFDRLKKVYDKIKPVIEKIQEVIKAVSDVIAAVKKFDGASTGTTTLKSNVQSNDIYNVTAEWRNFDITVHEMEDSLREYPIDGKQEYFHALKTLVNNGQAYILTQTNLVQRGDELAIVLLQRKMEERDHTRLEKLAANVGTAKNVLDILKRAMFDRLLSIRSLVFLDFVTYSSAYNYHTLRKENVVLLSPIKPVVDYLEDIAKLQSAIISFGSTTLIQSRTFTLRTLCSYSSANELGSALAASTSVSFSLGPQNSLWQGFYRIRMSSVRCYLDGVKWKSSSALPRSLRLVLKTDGRFFDIDTVSAKEAGLPITADDGEVTAPLVSVTRAFVGSPRSLLFEYDPESGRVVCDGQWGQLHDYTKHSPMTNWEIGIVSSEDESQKLDFSGFQTVRMEFDCEVIWKG